MRPTNAILAGSLLLLVATSGTATVFTSRSGESGRIFFATFRPANFDIYWFAEPGAASRRLTTDPGLDYDPAISPDGRWVAFTSERRGNPDLFVLDVGGDREARLLVDSPAMEAQATFSPDGETLVFVSSTAGQADIYAMPFRPESVQGMNRAVRLTSHPGGDFRPSVSPAGDMVAFSSDRDHEISNVNPIARRNGNDIYIVPMSGGEPRRLTATPEFSGSPTFSADGREVYFYGGREGRWEIRAQPLTGSPSRRLVSDSMALLSPALTSSGRIGFAAGRPARGLRSHWSSWRIRSVDVDGKDDRVEADLDTGLWGPRWARSTGAMVAYGPGPRENGPPATETAAAIGPGPLLQPSGPWARELPDRPLDVYPIRELFVVAHPGADAILRTPPRPNPTLVISAPDGSRARELLELDPGFPATGVAATADGDWIVYTDGPMFGSPGTEADLWRMRPDGSERRNLTPQTPGNDGFPTVTSDGRWIIFRSGRDGDFDIYGMGIDGSRPRNLTRHPARDTFPAVSPRGDKVAFISDRDSPIPRLFDVYVLHLDADGSAGRLERITDNDVQEGHPFFSPDGEWIVFTSEMGGRNDERPLVASLVFSPQMYGELYAYRLDDGKLRRLTDDKWEDGFPTWVKAPGR